MGNASGLVCPLEKLTHEVIVGEHFIGDNFVTLWHFDALNDTGAFKVPKSCGFLGKRSL